MKLFSQCMLLCLITAGCSQAIAFGAKGHRIVAQIAENHLDPKAAAKIKAISRGQKLAQLATWPDEIRSNKSWDHAKPWHFLSIDDEESFENFPRSKDGDVWEALERFEEQLRSRKGTSKELWQALAFYVHFVGDIHQPLHVGRRGDYGGNSIKLNWFGNDSNLHSVWDEGLIESEKLSFTEFASFIDEVSTDQKVEWQSSSYVDWAMESRALRDQVYDFGKQKSGANRPSLSYEYVYVNREALQKRMVQGGIRLAAKLNDIFAD